MSKSGASSGLKIAAIIIVIVTVLMKLHFISFPIVAPYTYWLVVIAFCLVLISDRA